MHDITGRRGLAGHDGDRVAHDGELTRSLRRGPLGVSEVVEAIYQTRQADRLTLMQKKRSRVDQGRGPLAFLRESRVDQAGVGRVSSGEQAQSDDGQDARRGE
jgi:hypothetical protein